MHLHRPERSGGSSSALCIRPRAISILQERPRHARHSLRIYSPADCGETNGASRYFSLARRIASAKTAHRSVSVRCTVERSWSDTKIEMRLTCGESVKFEGPSNVSLDSTVDSCRSHIDNTICSKNGEVSKWLSYPTALGFVMLLER